MAEIPIGGDMTMVNSEQLNGDSNLVSPASEHVLMNGMNEEAISDPNSLSESAEMAGPSHRQSAPNYDDLFPALPGGVSGPGMVQAIQPMSATAIGHASNRPKIRSSKATVMYHVTADEVRYREQNRRNDDFNWICADIMAKTGTEIQLTHSRDGALTFLISGKHDATAQAKRMLTNEFQAQIVHTLPIPKEHHRLILGKAGNKLLKLEQTTQTRIQIPKQDEKSDVIRITGTREAIDKAVQEIQSISNDAFSRHMERINIPKVYHPFITGPFGETIEKIYKETGAKVNMPPLSSQRDEIVIIGERNNVNAALERVKAIADRMLQKCQCASIDIKKAQHKYIVGPKASTLNEILRSTGVSVEMPPTDSPSEKICLRGEPENLPKALAMVMEKANSETDDEVHVPGWIHRHILGPKGAKFQELSQEFPKVNVSFNTEDNRIKLSGPVADVQKAGQLLQQRAKEIASQFAIEEIKVNDPNHIKFIVGKNGANLKNIREETKATIQVITDSANDKVKSIDGNYIRIEGSPESVAKAKKELGSLLEKLTNEATFELTIERRFYGQIIGAKGEKIRDIRNKYHQINIIFPEQNDHSEKVIIRGAKQDAEQCFNYLAKLNQELLASNYRFEVPILKQLLHYQGKDSIKKIREDLGVRMDVQNDNDSIVITGPKDKVEKAYERVQALQNSLSDMAQVDIIIPSRIHNYMLGSRGRNIRTITVECGDVIITFPPEGSKSDRVTIRGTKDSVQKAKQMLIEKSNEYQTNNHSEELKVPVQHHRYLIGKSGSNINKLREQTNVRVQFASDASSNKEDADRVVITGKKEDVQKARAILEAKIKELENVTELEMRVDPKYHHLFVAKRAAVCKQLSDEYGGVNISFPPQSDKTNDRIVLKGSKECLDAVKQRILEMIEDYDAQETIEVEIDAQHHRQLLSRPNNKINALQQEFDVKIKFPAKPNRQQQEEKSAEPNEENVDNRANIVTITGRRENCEKAKKELMALIPISIEVSIPYEFHRFIIGQKGADVKELMEKHNVNIRVPQPSEKSDIITVTGAKTNTENARNDLLGRLGKWEEEKADREARSFQLTFQVEPIYHSKIIGKRGAIISTIRSKFDVQIQVPEQNRNNSGNEQAQQANDIITVIGYEQNANKAKEYILKLVQEYKDMTTEQVTINNRIHSRIIGSKGANIKRIMHQFKVDIKFPRTQNGENPDTVTITGAKDNVEECKQHLLELEEEYLDDTEVQYQPPGDLQINFDDLASTGTVKESPKGFTVRGGPWEKRRTNQALQSEYGHGLDVSSAQDFPAFGPNDQKNKNSESDNSELPINGSLADKVPVTWGPKRD